MRIVVSGTHASGKSTLISDFALRHPSYTVLADPFEEQEEAFDQPGVAMFAAQLRLAADRLTGAPRGADLIAERGPLDFLAYLLAHAEVTGRSLDDALLTRACRLTTEATSSADLVIVLPLTSHEEIYVGSDEHPELRAAMNDALLDLIDSRDVMADHITVVELTGDPATRLAALEALVPSVRGSEEHRHG